MKKLTISLLYSSLTLLVFISILYPRNNAEEFILDLEAHQNLNFSETEMLNQPNINFDDYYGVFSEIDNSFFPPGKTPKYIILSLWGIEPGKLWPELGYPYTPISGNYVLTHMVENVWVYKKDELLIRFWYTGAFFIAQAHYVIDDVFYTVFFSRATEWLYLAGANTHVLPEFFYFVNGFFQASWLADVDPVSVKKIADDLGFENDKKAFYAGLAESDTTATYRISRLSDGTCIKIKVDKSFTPG